VLIRKANPK